MACYINKNDITFFSISEGLKHQVVFSYLDDIDSNFIKEYRELIGNDSIIQIDKSNDKRLEKIIKERMNFYQENPEFNKFEKVMDQFNNAVDIIKDNESNLSYN